MRLHVVELGLARGAPGAEPALVLVHGASGNLEDMRLALGEKLAASHRVILIDRPGHGWSARPDCDDDASPARQAEFVAARLNSLACARAILLGHSWGGAFATAYALAFPERTAGLVLLSAPTHPWPANPGWYNKLALLPYLGPLFLRTCVLPLGLLLAGRRVTQRVRAASGAERLSASGGHSFGAASEDILLQRARPRFARELHPGAGAALRRSAYADHHHHRRSRHIWSHHKSMRCALAAALPSAKLVTLKDIGHMPHHAAPEVIAAAIDELIPSVA